MKRNLSALLLIAMLAGLASCGGTSNDPADTTVSGDTTAPEVTTELTDGLPDKDMDGFELRLFNYDGTWFNWAINQLTAESENGELINDTIYKRNRNLEERFHATITETVVAEVHKELPKVVLAGDDVYDLAQVYDQNVAQQFSNGYTRAWNNMPHINFDAAWWSTEANNVFNIGGNQIAAVGDFSLSMHSRNYVYIFNKDMLSEIHKPADLYASVDNGTWTVEKLFSIAKDFVKDVDGNGTMDENDRYGITGAVKLQYGSMLAGAGVRYIESDKDGKLFFNMPGNDFAFEVMEKIFNLHENDTYKNYKTDISGTDFDFFHNGHTLILSTSMAYIERFRDMDADIGFLPVPKYTEKQENYHCLSAGGAVAVLPSTVADNRLENIGMLLEAMSFASRKELVPAYLETTVKTKYTRDDDSSRMLQIVLDSSFYDLGVSLWPGVTQNVYMEKVYLHMENVIASTTESMAAAVQAEIDKLTVKE